MHWHWVCALPDFCFLAIFSHFSLKSPLWMSMSPGVIGGVLWKVSWGVKISQKWNTMGKNPKPCQVWIWGPKNNQSLLVNSGFKLVSGPGLSMNSRFEGTTGQQFFWNNIQIKHGDSIAVTKWRSSFSWLYMYLFLRPNLWPSYHRCGSMKGNRENS